MGLSAGKDVKFDFDGSLALARALWHAADELESGAATRLDNANIALKSWEGERSVEFVQRGNDEQSSLATVVANLRYEAEQWASAWQNAMDQQNRVLYARKVQQIEDDRSGWDSFWGGMFGHDDLPPEPQPVTKPTAAGFYPTATFYTGS